VDYPQDPRDLVVITHPAGTFSLPAGCVIITITEQPILKKAYTPPSQKKRSVCPSCPLKLSRSVLRTDNGRLHRGHARISHGDTGETRGRLRETAHHVIEWLYNNVFSTLGEWREKVRVSRKALTKCFTVCATDCFFYIKNVR